MKVINMMFENKEGKLILPEELDELPLWEIEDMGIHVYEDMET
jgi:hypothetical protein